MSVVTRALRAFGRFWLDFLVGDTPELFVGTLVVIGGALALRHHRPVGLAFVLIMTVALFATSTIRGRKKASS
jgi:hypothetical protein